MYTPVHPSFTIQKWGLRGSNLYRHVFMMKTPSKFAADNILIFLNFFQRKFNLIFHANHLLQMIHMKCQVLFTMKNYKKKSQNIVCCSFDWCFRVKSMFFEHLNFLFCEYEAWSEELKFSLLERTKEQKCSIMQNFIMHSTSGFACSMYIK